MDSYEDQLNRLRQNDCFRSLPRAVHEGRYIRIGGRKMLNLSSNDYLGLAADASLRDAFLSELCASDRLFSASSSRLLTGNYAVYTELEASIAARFGREAALLFNSGYHANLGILPAVCDKRTLILADKLVHASLIDGMRLSGAPFVRYRHNDFSHLDALLRREQGRYDRYIVVTESIFSMDGDTADLRRLVELKRTYPRVWLYVDEAHAVGVRGATGLGVAEETGTINEIDFLVGTFGKALASAGAYTVCSARMKDFLVNTCRPLIFSTALPPVNIAWSYYVFGRLPRFSEERRRLAAYGERLGCALRRLSFQSGPGGTPTGCSVATGDSGGAEAKARPGSDGAAPQPAYSHILPYILGDNAACIRKAEALQESGFYVLPVRPPTVPAGTSRLRFSLNAALTGEEIDRLIACLE